MIEPPKTQESFGASCLCLTYGRTSLLEEAIESYLRQTWDGPKELIVLNDHPQQELVFDHPGINIFNIKRRLRTLGEKRNLSIALAKYDNLLVWDDDDIYLPWRLTETMKTLPTNQFYKCPNAWCIVSGVWQDTPGFNLYHGGTAYTRWLINAVRGYKHMDGGEDGEVEEQFQSITPQRGEYWPHTTLTWDRLYYVYRWGHGQYHTTGQSLRTINPPVKQGVIKLNPHWQHHYDTIALEKAKAQPK